MANATEQPLVPWCANHCPCPQSTDLEPVSHLFAICLYFPHSSSSALSSFLQWFLFLFFFFVRSVLLSFLAPACLLGLLLCFLLALLGGASAWLPLWPKVYGHVTFRLRDS